MENKTMTYKSKLDEIIEKRIMPDQEYIRMCDENIDMLTVEVWQLKEKLNIAVKALENTQKKLLKLNLAGLSSDDRHALYDLMYDDGTIDEALNKIRSAGK